MACLFQNFNEHLSQEEQELAGEWALAIIKFIDGSELFPSCQSQPDGAMAFGPGMGFVKSGEPGGFGRRGEIFRLAERVGFDELNWVLGEFLAGGE